MNLLLFLVTEIADIIVTRLGSYGDIQVDWQSGYQPGGVPPGFILGTMTPQIGSIDMIHGQEEQSFRVQVNTLYRAYII